jgi:predicted nucleic acid-binding Zn ribbon protein
MSRPAPRSLADALGALTDELAPATTLARVQEAWSLAAGPTIAAAARPISERDGVLVLVCESSVWASELDLMAAELVPRINAALGSESISALRCRTG